MFLGLFLAIFATLNIEKYAEGKYKTVPPASPAISFADSPENAKIYVQAVFQNHSNSLTPVVFSKPENSDFDITQAFDYVANNGTKGVLIDNTHKSTGQRYRTFVVGQWSILKNNIAHILKGFHEDYQKQYSKVSTAASLYEQEKEKEKILISMQKEIKQFNDKKIALLGKCEKNIRNEIEAYPSVFGVTLLRYYQDDTGVKREVLYMEEIDRIREFVYIEERDLTRVIPFEVLQHLKEQLNNFYKALFILQGDFWRKLKPLLDQYKLLDETFFGAVIVDFDNHRKEESLAAIRMSAIKRIERLVSIVLKKKKSLIEEL